MNRDRNSTCRRRHADDPVRVERRHRPAPPHARDAARRRPPPEPTSWRSRTASWPARIGWQTWANASHVAHEVRNSLVPMKLYLSLLSRRLSDDSGSQDIFEKVSAGFVALEATVSDLLNFSAERDPQRRSVDVESLLNEVFETFAPQLEAQGIATHIDADQHALIYADPDMLRRAIVNLVLNALDFIPAGRARYDRLPDPPGSRNWNRRIAARESLPERCHAV